MVFVSWIGIFVMSLVQVSSLPWHLRLGHVPAASTVKEVVSGINRGPHKALLGVSLGQASSVSFPISTTHSSTPYDIVHMDLCHYS